MLQFSLFIFAVLVGGIFAASVGLTAPGTNKPPSPPNMPRSIVDILNLKFTLNDFVECTELEKGSGYVKYDGSSNCVNVYSDAGCSVKKDLNSVNKYVVGVTPIGRDDDVEVCNPRREASINNRTAATYCFIALCIICVTIVGICQKYKKSLR